MGWESIASAKRASLINLIPPTWRISPSDIPSTSRLRDFGDYICRFLNPQELEITNASSSIILAHIRSAEWSAVDVTRAFCHRAAIAHQLVCNNPNENKILSEHHISMTHYRPPAYPRFGSSLRKMMPGSLMSIFFEQVRL